MCVCVWMYKQDLALNNRGLLICHKTQPTIERGKMWLKFLNLQPDIRDLITQQTYPSHKKIIEELKGAFAFIVVWFFCVKYITHR